MTEKANLKEIRGVELKYDLGEKFAAFIEFEKPIEHGGFLYCSYNIKSKTHAIVKVARDVDDPYAVMVDLPEEVLNQIKGDDYDLMDMTVEAILRPDAKALAIKKKKLVTLR